MFGTLTGLFGFIKNPVFSDILFLSILFLIVWFIKEKIYYIPKIDGKWEMTLLYEKSTYKPYLGMEVYYTLFIHQNGSIINIDSEKNAEKQPMKRILNYAPRGKTLGNYYGNIQRSYMNHPVILNIREDGLVRNVVGRLNLKAISNCQMEGTFEKGDATSSGKVICTKVV
ncbi:MAG: hypothetical protein PHR87_06195 [Sulfurospirillaceae bacterium]|nr:hypothetical protein [Sulfurospirillaceae bacterium]